MKKYIRANSQIGEYRGVQYGLEDTGDMRFYFRASDGSLYFADTEEELFALIDDIEF